MKSLILVSILLTACGMQKTDQAIADRIATAEVPESAKPLPTADATVVKPVAKVPDIIETPKVAIDAKPAVQSEITTGVVEQPKIAAPVTEVPQVTPVKQIGLRTCETYLFTSPVAFKMKTEFFDDGTRKHTISMNSNGSGQTVFIPQGTVVVQKFDGSERPDFTTIVRVPMSLENMAYFNLNGAQYDWGIEVPNEPNSTPIVRYGYRVLPSGSTMLGKDFFLGYEYFCRYTGVK